VITALIRGKSKSQAPNPKEAPSHEFKITELNLPTQLSTTIKCFGFGFWRLFGIWGLGFGILDTESSIE
jgi:hypothetical protein